MNKVNGSNRKRIGLPEFADAAKISRKAKKFDRIINLEGASRPRLLSGQLVCS